MRPDRENYPHHLEYRYKWQDRNKPFPSFQYCKNIEEIIDWWESFNNYTLEDYTEIDNIEEINIYIHTSPYVIFFNLYRNRDKKFDIDLIVNDYPYAKLNNSENFGKFLKIFFIDIINKTKGRNEPS